MVRNAEIIFGTEREPVTSHAAHARHGKPIKVPLQLDQLTKLAGVETRVWLAVQCGS